MAREKRKSMRDRVRKHAEESKNRGGGFGIFNLPDGKDVTFFKPKKGTMNLDLLPFELTKANKDLRLEPGDLWYEKTFWVHNGIGAEDKKYLCLKTIGKRCPICDQRTQLAKTGNADQDLLKDLLPKERQLFQLIDLDDEDKGIQLWDFSYHLFGKQLEMELREQDEECAGFAELEGGFTLKIRFDEKKFGSHTFCETNRIDFKQRDDYGDDILEDVLPLDDMFKVVEYDALEAIFLETDDEAEAGEEEEQPSRKRTSRKKEEKKEEELPFDPDEKEDKPEPEKKRRGRKAVKEEEPAEEQEPEKEEKPATRTRTRAKKEEPKDDGPTCPEGKKFGYETNDHDCCSGCPDETWDACSAARDENEK